MFRLVNIVWMGFCALLCFSMAKIEGAAEGFTGPYWTFVACMLGCILCIIFYVALSGRKACQSNTVVSREQP